MGHKVLFKTRGGHKEGIGDVASSLSLAEEFRKNGHGVLFIVNNNKNTLDLIAERNFEYKIKEGLVELGECLGAEDWDITVLNQLNTAQEEALIFRKNTKILVTIEDTGESAKLADLRFNILYPIDGSFSEFKYIPLSSVFQQKHSMPKIIKENVETILVMQGGSDTYGFTPKIMKALCGIPADINIRVILGPNFSHYRELDKVLDNAGRGFDIIKEENDLSDLMLEADLAISAAGNTLFELACLGIPAIVVCGECFEVETAARLVGEGFGINLGFGEPLDENIIYSAVRRLMLDVNLRSQASKKGRELVDGSGAQRIVEKINRIFYQRFN